MTSMTDSTRIESLRNVQQAFIEAAKPGYKIHLGLEGDTFFPNSYRGGERPEGTVIETLYRGDTKILRADFGGKMVEFSPYNYDSNSIFEFTPDSFQQMLLDQSEKAAASFRGSGEGNNSSPPPRDYEATYRGMESKLDSLMERMSRMEEAIDTKFRGMEGNMSTLVEGMEALASDIVTTSKFRGNGEFRGSEPLFSETMLNEDALDSSTFSDLDSVY